MNGELVFALIFIILLLGSCAVIDTLSTNPDAGLHFPPGYMEEGTPEDFGYRPPNPFEEYP